MVEIKYFTDVIQRKQIQVSSKHRPICIYEPALTVPCTEQHVCCHCSCTTFLRKRVTAYLQRNSANCCQRNRLSSATRCNDQL